MFTFLNVSYTYIYVTAIISRSYVKKKKLKAKNTHGEKWTEDKKERRPSHGPMTVALLPRVPNSLFVFLSLSCFNRKRCTHIHTHTHKISGCIQRKRRLAWKGWTNGDERGEKEAVIARWWMGWGKTAKLFPFLFCFLFFFFLSSFF